MNWEAYPGRKVVCIRECEPRPPLLHHPNVPELNCVYTIRSVGIARLPCECVSLRLYELVNPEVPWPDGTFGEGGFMQELFRPLDDRHIDIEAIFRALLPLRCDVDQ